MLHGYVAGLVVAEGGLMQLWFGSGSPISLGLC